jgi:two-component system response regulator
MNDKGILLVEDNADDAELTLRAFRKNNIHNQIRVARDGVEAIASLFGSGRVADPLPELPALVLLDLKLPKIDGLEVLRRIRADGRTRSLPVVVLSSSNEQEDLLKSYQLGVNSYVRKPVDFSDFLMATLQLGLYWLVLNVPPPKPE